MRSAFFSCLVAVAATATLAAAADCTPADIATFNDANATVTPRCVTVLRDFGTCADDCVASFTRVVEKAPACTAPTVAPNATLVQAATAVVKKCEAARANATAATAYVPKIASPDAPACTANDESDWDGRFGPDYLFGACSVEALENNKCTTECLNKIEEGVQNAPACRRDDGDLLFSESVKFHLVRCLRARHEPLDKNAVLQAVATTAPSASSGKNESATTTTKPSNDTPTLPVVTTVTVAPTPKPTSGASVTALSSVLVIVAAVAAMLL